jgi:hypothetical protein
METVYSELIALAQVIVIDLVLAGDNVPASRRGFASPLPPFAPWHLQRVF